MVIGSYILAIHKNKIRDSKPSESIGIAGIEGKKTNLSQTKSYQYFQLYG